MSVLFCAFYKLEIEFDLGYRVSKREFERNFFRGIYFSLLCVSGVENCDMFVGASNYILIALRI